MPPKASPYCREEGCQNPRYIYPAGWKCQYCREHMKPRSSKRRDGDASMTGQMRDILRCLRQSKAQGFPFAELCYPFAHGITIKNLIERDWIFESAGLDGTRYKITGRGEDALARYEPHRQRRDGICPRCGQNPRHVRSSGRKDGFCIECLREIGREKRVQGNVNGDIERPRPRCHKRPRHQYPSGIYSTYCKPCERVNRRRNARKQRREIFKQVQAGAPVPVCRKCKAEPRRIHTNSISEYCVECGRVQIRKSKLRAILRKVLYTP